MRESVDQRARCNTDFRSEEYIWLNYDVGFNQRIMGEEHGFRGDERCTGQHDVLTLAVLPDALCLRQFCTIVDTDYILDRHFKGCNIQTFFVGETHNIGEIIFALGIFIIHCI